ncbi:hypothetical protein MMC30_005651 [Trapelia coarctata]|nr:hypothetical protein [Trapelia coarctata]
MQRHVYSVAAMAVAFATGTHAQSSSVNPLNQFISVAGSAVTVIQSAVSTQIPASTSASSTSPTSTTASSTSATAAASSTAAAAAAPSYNNKLNIIIPVVVIVGLILLAALALCIFCCLRRRRRNRRAASPVGEDEVTNWRGPNHPGRTYSPVRNSSQVPMSQQPTVPLMAATDRHYDNNHPAYGAENRAENPFVPIPPQPRKTAPNARSGLTDGTVAGAPAFIGNNGGRLRKSSSFSRDRSGSGLNDAYNNGYNNNPGVYPVLVGRRSNNLNNGRSPLRKPVPSPQATTYPGLTASTGLNSNPHNSPDGPYAAVRPQLHPVDTRIDNFSAVPTTGGPHHNHSTYAVPVPARSHSPYNSVGSPLHPTHINQLSTSPPSTGLHYADRVPAPVHPGTFETVPASSEIPHPTPAQTRRTAQRPGFQTPPLVPSRSPNRHSGMRNSTYESGPSHEGSYGSASGESWQTGQMQPPPAPWEDRERRYSAGSAGRRYSGSPRGSAQGTPPGGTPTTGRRLRFSDLPQEPDYEHRYSQGVGEAL